MSRAKEGAFKLYNLRFLPLFAAYLILGIFCVKLSFTVAAILGVVAILSVFGLLFTRSIRKTAALLLIAVLLLGYGAARLELYFRNEVGLSGEVTVTCRAVDVREEEDGFSVIADRVKKGGKGYDGKLAFFSEECVSAGDRLTLTGTISIKKVSLDNIVGALEYRKGAKYQMEVTALARQEGEPPLSYRVKGRVRETLLRYEGERAGGFSYAMLFGDAEYMEAEDKSAMREVGVGHIFAVSGLHIGVLASALLFLLRKLRVKDGVSLLILLPIFGFYAYLAEFTPSVLRACIMVLINLAASALGERYDGLSALSFAAILILFFRPLWLFDISFIMSFLSILGIFSLARPLEKALLRLRAKPRFASAAALSLSVTLALLPVSAVVFGKISLAGFALNLLVVPLAAASYILTMIVLLPAMIFPSFGALLKAVSYLPLLISAISGEVAELGLTVSYRFSVAEMLLYYLILFFAGGYSLAKKKVKLTVAGMGAGVLTLLIFLL